jgi:hypothetical protein
MKKKKFDEATLKKAKFCKDECPGCAKGRQKGKGFLYLLMHLERYVCPYCRAYEKVYGIPVWEKVRTKA